MEGCYPFASTNSMLISSGIVDADRHKAFWTRDIELAVRARWTEVEGNANPKVPSSTED